MSPSNFFIYLTFACSALLPSFLALLGFYSACSFLSGNLVSQIIKPERADAMVKMMIGIGSSSVEMIGDMAEKTLLRKLQMPRAVAQKGTGNTSALLT